MGQRAIRQREQAEAYAAKRGLTPDQAGFWSLTAGVLAGHLAERDDEQDAAKPAPLEPGYRRVKVTHEGVPLTVDLEYEAALPGGPDEPPTPEWSRVEKVWAAGINITALLSDETAWDIEDVAVRELRAGRSIANRVVDLPVPAPRFAGAAA